MTLEFQSDLLKYLFTNKEAKKYARYLDETVFDNPIHQIIFKLWKEYVKKYKVVPSKANFTEYFERNWAETKNSNATEDVRKSIINAITVAYTALNGDTPFIRETIVNFAQKKLTRRLFIKKADGIETGDDKFFTGILKDMAQIVALTSEDEEKEKNKGHYYIAERDKPQPKQKIKAIPTPWHSLNRMTNVGGFYAPQLIVFMKGPKAYGTGILIKLAAASLKQGRKVFYADTENSTKDIYARLDMALLECKAEEVKLYQKELAKIKNFIALQGGEFRCDFFPGGLANMQDLDNTLTEMWEQDGFKPEELYNDYIDKFVPVDKSIKERRFKLSNVYEHQARLNDKWGFPCFTISPITGETNKAYYTVADISEDKAKPYNCHALFAMCCTDEEYKAGTMRIIPVAQRAGLGFLHNAFTTCALKVDRATGKIEELDSEAYLMTMDVYGKPEKAGKSRKFVDTKDIKDE